MTRPFASLASVLVLALASLAVGCTTSSVVNEAEPPAPETAEAPAAEPPADAPKDEPAAPPAGGDLGKAGLGTATPVDGQAAAAKGSKGDGASCDKADECTSGVCEGEGCGAGQGKCAPKDRPCTRDLRPYCGCDGKTFQSSGSCPGQRFSKKAACEGDPSGPSVPKP